MTARRQMAWWGLAALLSLVLVSALAVWQSRQVARARAVHVASTPAAGSVIFRNKGCAACHGATGGGTDSGPALRQTKSLSTLPRLVSAMWNHAPRMWQAMEARQLPYPTFSYEETAQLVTYLYISGYADNNGDSVRGAKLYEDRGCAQCHSSNAEERIAFLSGADDPLTWTQTLWNHGSVMHARMNAMGISWPKFQASDLRDLHAYVRQVSDSPPLDPPDISGDPDRGWNTFQQKGCIRCHALSSEPARTGPSLGPERQLPPTFTEFGAALLNHFPQMQKAVHSEDIQLPRLDGSDISDIAVFLYSLHYLEPSGSPQVGKSIFGWRGCNRCHGDDAQGTLEAPALRGRGQTYTSIRLATDLWRHGARMYHNSANSGQQWPVLQESEIGHLLTFLNTSPEQ